MEYVSENMEPGSVDQDFRQKLKWLIILRAAFAVLMTGAVFIFQINENLPLVSKPFLCLYGLAFFIWFLSCCYAVLLRSADSLLIAFLQIAIDSIIVSVVIFLTGCFSSIFVFLYLVVVIISSIFLFRKGSVLIAALCSLQYGIMIDLEYYGVLKPFGIEEGFYASNSEWSYVIYKILIIMTACFAVAFLSDLLAERERKAVKELHSMEEQVKRVEKLAAVGKMAAGLAHEIKNPLAALSGSIQLLKEAAGEDAKSERLMNIALREVNRLSNLVSDFLLFAKPQRGETVRLELDKSLSDIIALFEQDKRCSSEISVQKVLTPGIYVEMNRMHLHQVMWNLLRNAAEAIENEGSIRVELKPWHHRQAMVRIVDNGRGMTEDQLQFIFDPFFTTKSCGIGLGLSIVHRIMETYKCRVDVNTRPDRGTTFTLLFQREGLPA